MSERINGETRLAGVIGWPVAHSRSPALHNYWCARHDVNGAYVPLPVEPGRLAEALAGLVAVGFAGVNVTIPHKEEAFRLVSRHTHAARRAGAVNTIRFEADGTMTGDCTDGTGFVADLRARGLNNIRRALILGAGGAARAIAAALLDSGTEVLLANRTIARAQALADAVGGGEVVDWAAWPDRLGDCALLVNATALGLHGAPSLQWDALLQVAPPDLTVSDIVYVPLRTPLLQAASARGLRTIDGLGMLIEQARAGFFGWFGVQPEADEATRAHLLRSLG